MNRAFRGALEAQSTWSRTTITTVAPLSHRCTVAVTEKTSWVSFSLIFAVEAGSTLVILATVVTLVAWSIATFAQFPLQQYRLISVAPQEQSSVLSLNASAIQAGQGMGAGFGALILNYGALAGLGWGGALCALVALVVLGYGTSLSPLQTPHEERRDSY